MNPSLLNSSSSSSQSLNVNFSSRPLSFNSNLKTNSVEFSRYNSSFPLKQLSFNESSIRRIKRRAFILRADSKNGTKSKELIPDNEQSESLFVRFTVQALTELLRIAGFEKSKSISDIESISSNKNPLNESLRVSNNTSIVDIIKADYEKRSYFLTGNITDSIYDDDCFFGDPTVKFTGREKWKRNIKLLIPFFEDESIKLKGISQIINENKIQIQTKWTLRTYLKFPWRPLIVIDGSTLHTLNEEGNKVIRHVESWEVSGIAAIAQMFIPSEKSKWKIEK